MVIKEQGEEGGKLVPAAQADSLSSQRTAEEELANSDKFLVGVTGSTRSQELINSDKFLSARRVLRTIIKNWQPFLPGEGQCRLWHTLHSCYWGKAGSWR